jgi:DNA-binding transcriptional ArsR family regulator
MKCPSYNLFFETISTKIRMEILCLLRGGAMSVSEICKSMNEEQSKISHNLKKLVECRVLEVKQEGKKRIYSLNKDTVLPILDLVEKHVQKYCGAKCLRVK